jgi:iron complex outermembrane receptor protein
MFFKQRARTVAILSGAFIASGALQAMADDQDVPSITVIGNKPLSDMPAPFEKYDLPQTTVGITAPDIEQTINVIDPEDAVKYMPSLFLRKRNEGDNQAVLETRTWGVNSSARSLVYVDDTPISALIANNNTIGAPRWGLVAPEEIARIDMLYGPFAAAYPGNSEGGVMLITTSQPQVLQATGKQSEAIQTYSLYGTKKDLTTSQTSGTIGNTQGPFSWFLSGNFQDSNSQPLNIVTNATAPAGTSGTITAQNKTGAAADVVGSGGLLHTEQETVNLKLGYDINSDVHLEYRVGYWGNQEHSSVQSYLTDATGAPTFGGVSGFASDTYSWYEDHLANSLSLKTDTKSDWDGEAVATNYTFLNDIQRSPGGVTATGTGLTPAGKIGRLDGTGWSTLDLKGIWRPTGIDGAHEVSAGLHGDQYRLNNPTYNTANWQSDTDAGSLFSTGAGDTRTIAAWIQDAWKFVPDWKLTLGAREEKWNAFGGYNFSGTTGVNQPTESALRFSPKASLNWQVDPAWQITASLGRAYRFPTVSELYQLVATGPIFTTPNPNLRPEQVTSGELAFERKAAESDVRLSLFDEQDSNALISQTSFLSGATPVTFVQNVNKIRNLGFELVVSQKDVFLTGLDLSGSVTGVQSRILSDPNFVGNVNGVVGQTTATGKHVPNVPDWRGTVQATYHPDDKLSFSVAARYSGKQYSTLDNSDTTSHVYGAFDRFFVVDVHVRYQIVDMLAAEMGIDNLNNDKYFLFHPFPQRTFYGSLKLTY